jgi:transcriptional regulator with XRE-family HTH domain
MPTPKDEREAFAERLRQALKRSPKKVNTAAELALQFNLRHPAEPITQQAAQKWLTGQARPTLEKVETLSEWLSVPAQWLLYGKADQRTQGAPGKKGQKGKSAATIQPTEDELKLLARIRSMPEHRRNLVLEIVEQLSLEHELGRE